VLARVVTVRLTDGDYAMKPEREPAEGEEDVPKIVIRSGKGVYKLDGNEFEGDWVDDQMQGRGTFKFMGGSVYNVRLPPKCSSIRLCSLLECLLRLFLDICCALSAISCVCSPVCAAMCTNQVVVFVDSHLQNQGEFVGNKFHGQGKYTWEHGAYYIGAW